MSEQIKKLAPVIWSEIQKANNILLCCHVRPDSDSVGSNLAMKLVLEKLGKKATLISGDDPPLNQLSFLPGFDSIKTSNFLNEVKNDEFDLFICLDISEPSRISQVEKFSTPLPIRTLVIDHHDTNTNFGDINLVEKKFSSTCELIYEIIEEVNPSILDSNIADCLYTGIWGDTVGFKSLNTTSETYKAAANLIAHGANFQKIISALTTMKLKFLRILGYAFSNAKQYFSGQVLITKISHEVFVGLNISESEIGEAKEYMTFYISQNEEAAVACVIYEYAPGKVSISLRSNNLSEFRDVAPIAQELGGGGHKQAAAGKMDANVDEAEKKLLKAIQKIYPNLGQP